jgi:hypothetical protein
LHLQVTKGRDGQYILKANNPDYADLPATDDMRTLARLRNIIDPLDLALGESFMREDIPTLFGEAYNPGNWNVGHVVLAPKKAHILLVTGLRQLRAQVIDLIGLRGETCPYKRLICWV